MVKFIFLEGLPGVGKTTLVKKIKSLKLKDVYTVDEIIKEDIKNRVSDKEEDYIMNDEMKLNLFSEGIIVVDRGPISTLSYNHSRNIIDNNFDSSQVVNWFENIKSLYSQNCKVVYLTNNGLTYKITSDNPNDPYGSIDNQKLLESITLFNCSKYCSNFIKKDYYQKNMEELIYEIIN